MDIIVTRSRIAGTLPFYEYRALAPLWDLSPGRLQRVRPIPLPHVAAAGSCIHIAQLIAPDAWFTAEGRVRASLGERIKTVARRVEAVLVRSRFPEMHSDIIPVIFRNDADPGDACRMVSVADLTGAFDRLEPLLPAISVDDLGLVAPARLAA